MPATPPNPARSAAVSKVSSIRSAEVGLMVLLLLAFALTGILVFHGQWNIDEGFYLYCTQLLSHGNWPYADFGFTQPPLVLFAFLPVLELFGYSLLGIRIAAAFWTWAGVLGVVALLWHRQQRMAALTFLFQLLLSYGWMVTSLKGRNYPVAATFLLLATAVVLFHQPGYRKWIWFTLAAALAVLARYPAVFGLIPLALLVLCQLPCWRTRCIGLAGSLLLALLLVAVTTFGDWEAFRFWTIDYHLASEVSTARRVQFTEFFRLSLIGWIALPVGLILSWKHRSFAYWVVGASFLGVLVMNLVSSRTYGEYSSIYVPSILLWASLVLASGVQSLSVIQRWLAGGLVVLVSVGFYSSTALFTTLSWGMVERAQDASAFLRSQVNAEGRVIAAPLEIAVEAGCSIPPVLSMGVFAVSDTLSSDEVERYRLLHYEGLLSLIRDPQTQALILYRDPRGNFMWSVPTIESFPRPYFDRFSAALEAFYAVGYADIDYVVLLRQEPIVSP